MMLRKMNLRGSQNMHRVEKIDLGAFGEADFQKIAVKWISHPISYRILYEATIIISSRFIFEATGIISTIVRRSVRLFRWESMPSLYPS